MAATRFSAELMQAALGLIAEQGIDGLTLRQVAARAGVSRATAYREFGDKDRLVSALAEHEIQQMIAAVVAAIDPAADPADRIASVMVTALRYLRGHRAFIYVRDNEPHWLLRAMLKIGDDRMDLVQTVSGAVAVTMQHDPRLALPPAQAAEFVVRTVLSHLLVERSALSDRQIAEAVGRAVLRP
ncbi:TetR/AcrR family transcriptional regulator [Mycolicibacillus trivialis]|nr:TetR/AcrR family transcriptional regulator [Mycolicibacillus trivialis]